MDIALLAKWHQEFGEKFPRRLTAKQKEGFLNAIEQILHDRNFETERLQIRHWRIPNRLLITKCEDPDVIFMAHYDTPTIMPPGITWIYKLFGHTRQLICSIILILLILMVYLIHSWLENIGVGNWSTVYLLVMSLLFLIPIFFPNPQNAEDNTSGVLGLLALADWVKDKSFKDKIQFAFLDNEEWGLIGSQALRQWWLKRGHLTSNLILINLDCVSRGQKPLIIHHQDDRVAREVLPYLQPHLPHTKIFDMKNIPLSDNYTFRNENAVDISYADETIFPGGYYIPKVHAPSDRDFSPKKTAQLIDGLTDYLLAKLSSPAKQTNDPVV